VMEMVRLMTASTGPAEHIGRGPAIAGL